MRSKTILASEGSADYFTVAGIDKGVFFILFQSLHEGIRDPTEMLKLLSLSSDRLCT